MTRADVTVSTARLAAPVGDVVQLYCCDPDVSHCGLDISGHPFTEDAPDEDDCVVCLESACEFCGCLPGQACEKCEDVP